jgi:hypothetical protein
MSKDIIDAIASGDNLGAESQFKSAIQQKVGDALEKRRSCEYNGNATYPRSRGK